MRVEVDHARQHDPRPEVDRAAPAPRAARRRHRRTRSARRRPRRRSRRSRGASAVGQRAEEPGAEHERRPLGQNGGHARQASTTARGRGGSPSSVEDGSAPASASLDGGRAPRASHAARSPRGRAWRRGIAGARAGRPAERRPTIGSDDHSSRSPSARDARMRPPTHAGPTPLPEYPWPKWTRPPSSVPKNGRWSDAMSIGPPHASSIRVAASDGNSRRSPRAADGGFRVVGEGTPDPPAEPCSSAAAPERDPSVGRRPQVVQREPGVAEALPAGPADLRERVGDRLGEHDVRGPRHQPTTERWPGCRPGVERNDDLVRADDPRPDRRRGPHDATLERGRPRALMDGDPALQRCRPKRPREASRLDRRPLAHEHAAAEDRRRDPLTDLRGRQLHELVGDTETLARLDGLAPATVLGGRSTRGQGASLAVPDVGAALGSPVPDRVDGARDGPRHAQRLRVAEVLDERRQLVPPGVTKPPLRPDGPPPQMSDSRSTTRAPGASSASRSAVHSPVYPPPRMTTSAEPDPANGGAAARPKPASPASSAASASRSHHDRRSALGRTPSSGSRAITAATAGPGPARRAASRRRGSRRPP